MARPEPDPVLSPFRGILRALGEVVLPGPNALDQAGWEEAEAIMEAAVAPRPPSVKKQLRLFLRLLNVLPLLTTGRTLGRLPEKKRASFLASLQRSRLAPLRRGLWGVRTLLFMGYYNQEAVRNEIGYRAEPGGWAVRSGEGVS
jgi:hypothetical protein